MNNLKSFLVTEQLKVNHAERYLLYVDRFHTEIFLDIQEHLATAWKKLAVELSKKHHPSPEAIQDAQLRNSDATIAIEVADRPEKIVTTRVPHPFEAAPSLKIPLVYSHDERAHFIMKGLTAAVDALKTTAGTWREIFNYEKQGQLKPWFKLTEQDNEVRFQLALTQSGSETYKTLYAVRVEHGKSGTKTRDFDRIYLYSLV